jgi:tRNA-splicing ligase RtcB
MQVIGDIPVCGDPVFEDALKQIQNCRETVEYAVLNADHHVGYGCPIGGVMASQELVSPTAVGYDIACGNKAVRLDADLGKVRKNLPTIMDAIAAQISFGIGRTAGWKVEHDLFNDPAWEKQPALKMQFRKDGQRRPARPLIDVAQEQLGTVGSGNHFVDVFFDENEQIWVGVHFGSRGFGHNVASYFLYHGNANEADNFAPPLNLHMQSDLGEQYIECMNLAGRYAYAGRDAVCAKVAELVGGQIVEEIHQHHNFSWREEHFGIPYWVGRKGATPAFPGKQSFIGGSMGDDSVIVEGVDCDEAKRLLYSTVHGAGRVISRSRATGMSRWGKKRYEPEISKEAMMGWIQPRGLELRGADVDEAPQAYKRLSDVLPQQGPSIRVVHTLRPIGVVMAGADVVDPYKD